MPTSTTTYAQYYCLKDGIDNLFIDETRDWHLVLGSKANKQRVDEMLVQSVVSKRPPRLVWVGDFGVGKTHHINYTDNKIRTEGLPFMTIRLELPDVVDSSSFNVLFERMVNEINRKTFQPLLANHVTTNPAWLETVSPQDIRKALRQLALNPDVDELAWDFLSGKKLTKDEKVQVGVSKLQLSDSEEFASVIEAMSTVIEAQTAQHLTLLYLIDEVEGLGAVTKPNSEQMWRNALRKVLDVKRVGAILAIGAQNLQSIPPIMAAPEIVRRFGQQNYIVLEQYDVAQIKSFLEELLTTFIDPDQRAALEASASLTSIPSYRSDLYPFTENAFEGYCTYLASEQARAKPSEFLIKLHSTLTAAMSAGKRVVDRAFLESRGEF